MKTLVLCDGDRGEMHLQYTLDAEGNRCGRLPLPAHRNGRSSSYGSGLHRVYTLKKVTEKGKMTRSAHPGASTGSDEMERPRLTRRWTARFSPDDKCVRARASQPGTVCADSSTLARKVLEAQGHGQEALWDPANAAASEADVTARDGVSVLAMQGAVYKVARAGQSRFDNVSGEGKKERRGTHSSSSL